MGWILDNRINAPYKRKIVNKQLALGKDVISHQFGVNDKTETQKKCQKYKKKEKRNEKREKEVYCQGMGGVFGQRGRGYVPGISQEMSIAGFFFAKYVIV